MAVGVCLVGCFPYPSVAVGVFFVYLVGSFQYLSVAVGVSLVGWLVLFLTLVWQSEFVCLVLFLTLV